MVSYYTKAHLVQRFMSCLFKKNMNFNIQTAATFVFFFDKNGLIKSCSSFEDLSVSKFHGSTLTGASFASTSEVWRSAILECLKVQD
jgi:hypothetical protein